MKPLWNLPTAHRGLHGGAVPENSLPAFQAAIEKGYAIETDVHFTKDNALVLFHDDGLSRMTGDGRKISDCTLNELRLLRLAGTDEKIPLLSELLSLDAGRTPILLEIKNEPEADAKKFLCAIKEAFEGYRGTYAVQSFQPLYVRAYKRLCPSVFCGLLTDRDPDPKDFSPPFARLKRHIVSHMSLNFFIKPDFISFEFHAPTKKAKNFKGEKFCWTVRSAQDEEKARIWTDRIIFEQYLPKI